VSGLFNLIKQGFESRIAALEMPGDLESADVRPPSSSAWSGSKFAEQVLLQPVA
jgi:hypothetical protein